MFSPRRGYIVANLGNNVRELAPNELKILGGPTANRAVVPVVDKHRFAGNILDFLNWTEPNKGVLVIVILRNDHHQTINKWIADRKCP